MSNGFTRFTVTCKLCGSSIAGFTQGELLSERLHDLSAPTRCAKCRAKKAKDNQSVGAAYVRVRKNVGRERLILRTARGVRKLAVTRPPVEREEYGQEIPPELAKKFSQITPYVEKVIEEFLDPNGRRIAILDSPTGTGKTVWASFMLLRSGLCRLGMILVTQPRLTTLKPRKAGKVETNLPGYVATDFLGASGIGPGQEIGFEHASEKEFIDRYNRLVFLTDGLLLTRIRRGDLAKCSVLVIDEAHEESVNMTLLFWLIRELLAVYPRLRIVLASATLDIERFVNYFGGPSRVLVSSVSEEAASEVPKTLNTIHDRWPEGDDGYQAKAPGFVLPKQKEDVAQAVASVVSAIRTVPGFTKLDLPYGNTVVFLPTIATVNATVSAIKALNLPDLVVFPCHAQLDEEEADYILGQETFSQAARRKEQREKGKEGNTRLQYVAVTTNYGETGITYPDLRYVIDSGLVNKLIFSPELCTEVPTLGWHHQAGCTQRRGRVGREQDGESFRLFTREQFEALPKNVIPEVQIGSLDMFLLRAKAMGVDDIRTVGWLGFDPNDPRQVLERERALKNLEDRGCFDEDGDLTRIGYELSSFQVKSVDFARFLRESDHLGCELEVATFISFVSGGNGKPFVDGEAGELAFGRWRSGCYDDLEFYIRLVYQWETALLSFEERPNSKELHAQWSRDNGLRHSFFKELIKSRNALLDKMYRKIHTPPYKRVLNLEDLHPTRLALALTVPEWIFIRGEEGSSLYVARSERCPLKGGVTIGRNSSCAAAEVEAFVCIGRKASRQGVLAEHVVRINPSWFSCLDTHHPRALAMLLERTTAEEQSETQRTVAIVRAEPPKTGAKDVKVGSLLKLKVLRTVYKADKGDARYLVESLDDLSSYLVETKVFGLQPGALLTGHVTGERDEVLFISQKRLIEEMRGQTVAAKVLALLPPSSDQPTEPVTIDRARVEVQPGLTGILYREDFGPRQELFDSLRVNGTVEVSVDMGGKGQLKVRPAHQELVLGMRYMARFEGEGDGQKGLKGGLFEVLPGVQGFLHESLAPVGLLKRLAKGEETAVYVVSCADSKEKRPAELVDEETLMSLGKPFLKAFLAINSPVEPAKLNDGAVVRFQVLSPFVGRNSTGRTEAIVFDLDQARSYRVTLLGPVPKFGSIDRATVYRGRDNSYQLDVEASLRRAYPTGKTFEDSCVVAIEPDACFLALSDYDRGRLSRSSLGKRAKHFDSLQVGTRISVRVTKVENGVVQLEAVPKRIPTARGMASTITGIRRNDKTREYELIVSPAFLLEGVLSEDRLVKPVHQRQIGESVTVVPLLELRDLSEDSELPGHLYELIEQDQLRRLLGTYWSRFDASPPKVAGLVDDILGKYRRGQPMRLMILCTFERQEAPDQGAVAIDLDRWLMLDIGTVGKSRLIPGRQINAIFEGFTEEGSVIILSR